MLWNHGLNHMKMIRLPSYGFASCLVARSTTNMASFQEVLRSSSSSYPTFEVCAWRWPKPGARLKLHGYMIKPKIPQYSLLLFSIFSAIINLTDQILNSLKGCQKLDSSNFNPQQVHWSFVETISSPWGRSLKEWLWNSENLNTKQNKIKANKKMKIKIN